MDEQVAARHRTIVARMTLALGAFGILSLFPEALAIGWHQSLSGRYIALLAMDAALGGAALVGGSALRRRSSWSWPFAASAWVAVAASSALLALVIVADFSIIGVWLPRFSFCVACLLAFPYVLWAFFGEPRSGRRPRFFAASFLVLLAAVSWLASAWIIQVHPITLQWTVFH